MTGADIRLVVAALAGILLAVLMIVRGRLHPFIGLLCGAFAVGLFAGLPLPDIAKAVQKGVGDIIGGTGLVVALGLSLGAMLHLSGAAAALAQSALRLTGARAAPWATLGIAIVIGLPLFFETGLVLLLPIVVAAAEAMAGPDDADRDAAKLRLIMPALAGLGVVHALVPPHPGPLLAVEALGANLGKTMLYGILIAIPTAIIAGPVLARFVTPGIRLAPPLLHDHRLDLATPGRAASLAIVLLPVLLIATGELGQMAPGLKGTGWLVAASNPVIALLVTNLLALPLLFGRRLREAKIQDAVWHETMAAAGAILLAIGAGGALKQVLVSAGLSDLLARLVLMYAVSPLLLGWLVAVGIRLAAGSATVATITAVGIMPGVVAGSGVSPELVVLAIGAGSVFFSHVNDPGFWLVKSYVGTSTADTFKTWSLLETTISVVGLALVIALSYVV
ncbi:GntT/GntP/DsdX family permease [Sphingomonas melonis]|jgi:GntP family gluconate:H+ symporter|uniref:GntP family gluconate:H+ symporter n=1 Tax=Sphingomonas melonis TaxID=152682 RepID=A0A7Y9FPL5_9SPHN|nr:gluconate:H+ symporter [Sphingomonas melonis]NYD89971.1 GntP family gluconate:H+ symporter [Sphingomonas melonis]